MLYNPARNTVHCNRGCTYDDLLIAEGLPPGYLPDEAVEKFEIRNSTLEIQEPVSIAKLHVVNALTLAHCFELKDEDFEILARHWGLDAIYGEEPISWPVLSVPGAVATGPVEALVKVCSMPTFEQGKAAAAKLAEHFDLTGVPGFYISKFEIRNSNLPVEWAIALPRNLKPGALLSPYYSAGGYIIGIRIHRSWRDQTMTTPWLLTSRGLPGGAKAIRMQQEAA